MGYHTDFKGTLKFTHPLTVEQKTYLETILGEWCLEHPEWNVPQLRYGVDLELLDDESGLQWNGGEKTYDMDQIVMLVIRLLQQKYPEFGLTGKLLAQGEDIDDRWQLYIENGEVKTRELSIEGKEIECPHCHQKFVYAS
ncbi:MAG: hypothetical protein DRR16_01235 [Candidatus Parabeggiatoa sp. nov. 3]|jgi:hypothetical protein|nr:MAG: hypothetical protein DRR00_00705 [Gammaproteobacteria bacterium]RKZ69748.1 MAG: hypothetical protein DRQ99_00125 [Gammaproteobacteria bacterium]RKZ89938.1 MAG: hypothetical protein DRR16_01235 [Gammaproteobacteria bacterium]